MITSVDIQNFKALRDATVPLERFTLLVGPNGSGKSTVIQGLIAARDNKLDYPSSLSMGVADDPPIVIRLHWTFGEEPATTVRSFHRTTEPTRRVSRATDMGEDKEPSAERRAMLGQSGIMDFSFAPRALAAPVQLTPRPSMDGTGAGLAGLIDHLRDTQPERFEQMNAALSRWIPEFNRILFSTPEAGLRSLSLRTAVAGHAIPATSLSDGTLISLGMLCLAYAPDPPTVVCLEEPDRSLHPRLLRELRDALYRLAYPESVGETREPVQVIATTHNPYFLDLFRDHPEEVVIVQKTGLDATFQRLSDRDDIEEILNGANLGEVWYTGVLGGVPAVP